MTAKLCELCERPCPKTHRACVFCTREHGTSDLARLLAWGERNPGHMCHRCDCSLLRVKDRDAYLCGDCMIEEGEEQAEADRIEAEHIEQERRAHIQEELARCIDFERPLVLRALPSALAELREAVS